jgi:fructose-1,6-bisphosphatase/inositol monophosphatase family enzyme
MKQLGYAMITLGFLAGALTAVVDKDVVRWGYFAGALIVGVVGIVLVRIAGARGSLAEEKLTYNMQAIETSLARIVEKISRLNAQKQSVDIYDIRHRIDELFPDDLTSFVQARESIAHVHGLQAYADVMSSFAAGERYLARVWSASADGYVDEVNTYLDKAQSQFVESLQRIRQLTGIANR